MSYAPLSQISGYYRWRKSCSSRAVHPLLQRTNMTLTHMRCTDCGCKDVQAQRTYTIKHGEQRTIYACDACGGAFSSTSNTPMAHLKTPISVIVQVLSALTEGVGINAATRLYGVSKNSIYRWHA